MLRCCLRIKKQFESLDLSYVILDVRILITFTIWSTVADNYFESEESSGKIKDLFTTLNSISFFVSPVAGFIVDRLSSVPRKTTIHSLMLLVICIQILISFLPLIKGNAY